MSKYFGNCSDAIDWDDVISHLEDNEPAHRFEGKLNTNVDIRNNKGTPENNHEHYILDSWREKNFSFDKINWSSFSVGKHYDKGLENRVGNILKGEILSSWISKVNPGDCCPAHWDLDSNVDTPLDKLVRFHIHMSAPAPGQIFVIETEFFCNNKQGDIFLWDSRRQYHASANCSFEPAYLFHCECYI
jgi:hypothetical protein